ncbi:MAG TPA: CDP-alcohol phosphatidyltransferase family protein [Aquifex aeolicus]|uniref:CDP-diacylglycerol--glycerol-3-phosphate 3-phosphatidyltransferase n=1 Tax=Aquifex aeolicus TaxID=63363 RepID=A0A7C5Q2R4_AQUAO|nr:CDP-alcohol phosphatidyltransferase family protein [Aquifex aeolicus]
MNALPNLLSFLRLLGAPGVFLLAYRGEERYSALLFVLLALTDALDGFLARTLRAETRLGKFLDPLADKVLLFFGLLTVTFRTEQGAHPLLIQLLIVRDSVLVGGTLLLRRYGFVPEPSLWGKLTTFVLSVTVGVGFLLELSPDGALRELFRVLQVCSGVLILVSAFDYTAKGAGFLLSKLIIEKR